jgi:imidazolonepropionase-like amidohydrolase
MKALFLIGAWAGAALTAHQALAQDFVIRGATLHTATAQGTLKHTDVLVHGGVIAAIGAAAQNAAGATVVEAEGKELTPGLFG